MGVKLILENELSALAEAETLLGGAWGLEGLVSSPLLSAIESAMWGGFGYGYGGSWSAPTVTAANESVEVGQSFAASKLIASATAPSGETIAEYAFRVVGNDGGALVFNGKTVANGQWVDVSAADLSELAYLAGASVGTAQVQIEATAGGAWSSPAVSTVTQTALPTYADAGLAADIAGEVSGGALTYSGMLTILEDAANGGMTAAKFETLQTLASQLNASGGISTSSYVESIADALIDGNPWNATWTGGANWPTALGDLSPTSTAAEVDDLIGKWFLGTDLPSTNVTSIGAPYLPATYQESALPLYGASNAPSYLDVNQGNDGDCYYLAAIAEVALQDPNVIESMIVSDGDGVYGVRFIVNGQDDWVTVNSELPTLTGKSPWANGSSLEFANGSVLWPALLEKAYVELGASLGGWDSYAAINGGTGEALSEITGQKVSQVDLNFWSSTSALASDNQEFASAFSSQDELLVGTPDRVSGPDLVADHMFEVIGYNASTDTLTLHNPWGSAAPASTPITFTETLSALAKDDCVVYLTSGKAVA